MLLMGAAGCQQYSFYSNTMFAAIIGLRRFTNVLVDKRKSKNKAAAILKRNCINTLYRNTYLKQVVDKAIPAMKANFSLKTVSTVEET